MSGKESPMEKRNVWKLVSVAFIALFMLIIAGGFINAASQPAYEETGGDAEELALSAVSRDLASRDDTIGNYEVSVTNRMVGFVNGHRPMGGGPDCPHCAARMGHVQVILRGPESGMLYLVDSDTGEIRMRSHTQWFG